MQVFSVGLTKTKNFDPSIVLAADGSVILGGKLYNRWEDAGYVKLNSSGQLDTNFGVNGIKKVNLGTRTDAVSMLALQSSGKIVSTGSSESVSRLNSNGSLDTTFGTSGISTFNYTVTDINILGDDSYFAIGTGWNGADADGYVGKFDSSGAAITSFGSSGIAQVGDGSDEEVWGSTMQSDGKIILVGHDGWNFLVMRLNTNGTMDNSFATNGKFSGTLGGFDGEFFEVIVQPDGKIIAVGYANNGSDRDFAVARFLTTGFPDTSFGVNGLYRYDGGQGNDEANSVVRLSTGELIAIGGVQSAADRDVVAVKLDTSGALVTGFGTSGIQKFNFSSSDEYGTGAALDGDGKVVVSGTTNKNDNDDFFVLRFLP